MAEKYKKSFTQSPTGANICYYAMRAEKKAKAIVQINHGMAEHAARYQRFATALSNHGYHVIAHDHRGHGHTTAPDAPLGVFARENGLHQTLEDIKHINSHASELFDKLPVIIFGHSMGTILGFNYCLKHPQTIVGAALWNSGFDTGFLAFIYKFLLRTERMFKGSDVPSAIAQKLTFEDWNKKFAPNRTEFDWLSRDDLEVNKYVEDPLCGFPVSIGLWLDVLEAIYFGANDTNLKNLPQDLPFHLQAGGADPCSEKGKAVQNLAERLINTGLTDVKLEILDDTRHESLNEINRDQTTNNFVNWLNSRF